MRINFVVVDSFTTRVEPIDCTDTKRIFSSTTEAVKKAFPGCAIFVWDGEAWSEVDESTEALLVEGASLKVVQQAPAGQVWCRTTVIDTQSSCSEIY